jgi:hypothetical protein
MVPSALQTMPMTPAKINVMVTLFADVNASCRMGAASSAAISGTMPEERPPTATVAFSRYNCSLGSKSINPTERSSSGCPLQQWI